MKRLSLILLLFASFAAKAQTYFTKPGIPPGSISKSFTGRIVTNATDSLTELWLGVDGNKFWKLDLAAQTRAYFDPLVFTGSGLNVGDPVTQDTIKKLIVFNPGIASVSGINNMSLSALSLNLQNTNFLFGVSPNHLEFINKSDTSQHYLDFNVSNGTSTNIRNNVPIVFEGQSHIKFKNLPQGVNGDSIAVWHDGILSRAVDNPTASPNQIINGLNFVLVDSVTLRVTTGVYRINNHFYSRSSDTTIAISSRDNDSSRYDAYYADTLNSIGRVQGVLSGTPVIPDIPVGTLYIGSVLITPTGPNLQPVNAYLPLNLTGTGTIVRGNENQFLRFSMTTGGTGSASFEVNGISSFYDFYTQAKTSSASSELFGDTTGFQMTNTNASNKSNIINIGAYSASGKGISIQLDQDSLFTYQNTNYETRLRNYGLGTTIPDMNILRSVTDSVKGTIPTIYSADGTISGNRTITQNANILTVTSVDGNFTSSFSNQGISGFQTGQSNSAINVSSSISSLAGIAQLSTVDSLAGGSAVTAATSLNNHTSIASIQTAKADASKFKMIEMYNQTVSGENGITFFDRIDSIGARYQSRDDYKYMGNDTLGIPPIGWVMRYVAAHAAAGNIYTIDGAIPTSTARTVTIPTGAQLILAANDGGTNFSTSTFAPSGITLNALGAGAAQVELNGTHAQFQYNQGGLENITFDASGEIIHDALGNIGLQYDSSVDSSQFKLNPLSLPDSKWVLNRIASYPHGTVTAITGTPSRITSTGGTTPAIDISSTFEALLQKTANFVDSETPSGAINGSNVTYTLANTPTTGSVHLYLNGIRVTTFTLSTNTITWTATAPSGSDTLLADYRK